MWFHLPNNCIFLPVDKQKLCGFPVIGTWNGKTNVTNNKAVLLVLWCFSVALYASCGTKPQCITRNLQAPGASDNNTEQFCSTPSFLSVIQVCLHACFCPNWRRGRLLLQWTGFTVFNTLFHYNSLYVTSPLFSAPADRPRTAQAAPSRHTTAL